jgi:hypothetical protein
MNDNQQTPIQEAISTITIASILIAVVCYAACLNNVPVLSQVLLWLATCVYNWMPILGVVRGPQIPMLVAAAVVGGVFFIVALPFAGVMARWFSASQLASLDRQTQRLRRNRARIVARRRDRDGYDVQ